MKHAVLTQGGIVRANQWLIQRAILSDQWEMNVEKKEESGQDLLIQTEALANPVSGKGEPPQHALGTGHPHRQTTVHPVASLAAKCRTLNFGTIVTHSSHPSCGLVMVRLSQYSITVIIIVTII